MIKAIKRNWFEIILAIFILLGVLISLIDLIQNKSLWLDEACLALNIVSRSYLELLTPLADNQSAPIGFLFTEKLLTNIFGPHDWALKIFPFFSFIVSIVLFFSLNNRLFKSVKIALLSCALFSLNFTLISYSTEVKQYSIDVLVAILIVLSSLKFNENKNSLSIFLHACIGAIAIWYSNVAVIILITAAIYNTYYSLFNNDKKELSVFIPISIWMASFITYYMLFISNHPHTNNMVNYWNGHFLPNNIFSQEFYTFLYDKVIMIFENLLNTNDLWGIALFFYSIGIFLLIKAKKTNYLHLLCLPIIIHLGLSFLHLYPFYDRFLLYQIPFVIIPISYGFILISSYFKNYHISKIMTICLLLTYTFGPSALIQSSSSSEEEIKKSLSFLNTHISSADHIYVYYSSAPAFKFYKNNYHNIKKENEIHFGSFSRGNPEKYISEIESISEDIWLIFSHMHTEGFPDKPPETEEQFIIEHLIRKNYIILLDAKFKDSSCYKIRKIN
tara:strand:- start:688 stop:2193 length:1506 start_codon:yes stop_codon:yes gene_type:complete